MTSTGGRSIMCTATRTIPSQTTTTQSAINTPTVVTRQWRATAPCHKPSGTASLARLAIACRRPVPALIVAAPTGRAGWRRRTPPAASPRAIHAFAFSFTIPATNATTNSPSRHAAVHTMRATPPSTCTSCHNRPAAPPPTVARMRRCHQLHHRHHCRRRRCRQCRRFRPALLPRRRLRSPGQMPTGSATPIARNHSQQFVCSTSTGDRSTTFTRAITPIATGTTIGATRAQMMAIRRCTATATWTTRSGIASPARRACECPRLRPATSAAARTRRAGSRRRTRPVAGVRANPTFASKQAPRTNAAPTCKFGPAAARTTAA